MSVIFDALNKLDREKRAPKTGMLIVGAGSIVERRGGVSAPLLGVSSVALVLLGAAAWWWTRDVVEPVPAPAAAVTHPPATAHPATGTRSARTPAGPTVMADDLAVVPVATLPATAARGTEGADLDPDPAPPPGDDPEPAQPTEPAQLRLEAITMRDDGPVAIVSGRIVREGDVFDGIAVVRIGATEIELLIQAEARTLVFRF